MWYVYVLESVSKKFIYIGSTNDLDARLEKHNEGLVQSTKAYRPYKVSAFVAVQSQTQAVALEKYFKTGSGKAILYKRILGTNPLATEASA